MPAVFAVVIILIQGILAFGHLVLYRTFVSIFSITNPSTLGVLKIIFTLLAVSFVVSSIVTFKFDNSAVSVFYTITAVWLGFLLYLFLAACLYWLTTIVFGMLGISFSLSLFGKFVLIVAMLVGIYGVVNEHTLKVTSIKVQLPNLPAEWKNKKAVWVSDIHLGQIYGVPFLNEVVSKVKTLQPDIIFVGGDVYDGEAFSVATSISPLSRLTAPLGTYFITGNHEEFGDSTKYIEAVKKAGMRVLNNELVDVRGLQLIGVDYSDTTNRDKFDSILSQINIDKTKPSILLKHSPTALDVADKYGINFQISGHTHRAQMWPLSFITKLVYKGFDYGLHNYGAITVYTSSGVGTWGPPLKVGNPSEIVLIQFE